MILHFIIDVSGFYELAFFGTTGVGRGVIIPQPPGNLVLKVQQPNSQLLNTYRLKVKSIITVKEPTS